MKNLRHRDRVSDQGEKMIYELIMAGGGGSRFWPLSRQNRPKQLLNLSGKDIMLNETILRMEPLIPREHAYIVTNAGQAELMKELLLPEVPREQVLVEPMGRNTAPCILYGAMVLQKKYGDGVMCVFPSDHHIQDESAYRHVMELAVSAAQKTGQLVTIGIAPTYPATGYGYISCGEKADAAGAFNVRRFVEKPDKATAEKYLTEGTYMWNSGVLVWKISSILQAFANFLPDMYQKMMTIYDQIGTSKEAAVLEKVYPTLENISIDYGIMEKSDSVLVIKGDYGWNDVGSLDTLPVFQKTDANDNLLTGDVITLVSRNCIVKGDKRLIALVGTEDLMVIDTPDALLICKKEQAQDVKQIVERLREDGRKEI